VCPRVVLLVDDDTLVLNSAAALLEDLGHRVLQANSGMQALSLLAQHPEVEVLVTDHAMPLPLEEVPARYGFGRWVQKTL
jgi:CheY-like chemotaxis protein